MKSIQIYIVCSLVALTSCALTGSRKPAADEPIANEVLEMVHVPLLNLKLRAGYAMETKGLKGCVIYLQGLADSVRNHTPYFDRLNEAGYRVIYFDYQGQGGSEGSMNDTRIQTTALNKGDEIQEQAEFFWQKYKGVKNPNGEDCSQSPKMVIGWSTGGLAAYRMAYEKRADAVILLAPGIHPKWMVGEALWRWDRMLMFRETITERTLTRNTFEGETNPHVDPIKPRSPAHVPKFAVNLVTTAYSSIRWQIPPEVKGLVLLSGSTDSYVNRGHTMATLVRKAPHFLTKSYEGALHELDNEVPHVANDVYEMSIQFLDSVIAKEEQAPQ